MHSERIPKKKSSDLFTFSSTSSRILILVGVEIHLNNAKAVCYSRLPGPVYAHIDAACQ